MVKLGSVVLEHVNLDYDAAKAHDYYMRTRILKNRQDAVQIIPVGRSGAKPVVTNVKLKTAMVAKPVVIAKPPMTTAQVKARVQALQTKLAILKQILSDLTRQIKARGGIATKATKNGASVNAKSTTAQNVAAAKSSASYYDKNKRVILEKAKAALANDPNSLDAQIKLIEEKIVKMRSDLASAMKR